MCLRGHSPSTAEMSSGTYSKSNHWWVRMFSSEARNIFSAKFSQYEYLRAQGGNQTKHQCLGLHHSPWGCLEQR